MQAAPDPVLILASWGSSPSPSRITQMMPRGSEFWGLIFHVTCSAPLRGSLTTQDMVACTYVGRGYPINRAVTLINDHITGRFASLPLSVQQQQVGFHTTCLPDLRRRYSIPSQAASTVYTLSLPCLFSSPIEAIGGEARRHHTPSHPPVPIFPPIGRCRCIAEPTTTAEAMSPVAFDHDFVYFVA